MLYDEWLFVGIEDCDATPFGVTFSVSCANVYALDGDEWVRMWGVAGSGFAALDWADGASA